MLKTIPPSAFEEWMTLSDGYMNTSSAPDVADDPEGTIAIHYQCQQAGSAPLFCCVEEECVSKYGPPEHEARCPSGIVAIVHEDASVTVVVDAFHYGHRVGDAAPVAVAREPDEETLEDVLFHMFTDSVTDNDDSEEDDDSESDSVTQETRQNIEVTGKRYFSQNSFKGTFNI